MSTPPLTDSPSEPPATPGLTYKDAGVDIDAQDEALRRAKSSIRSTFTPGVLGDVGLFGGLFDLKAAGLVDPVLVASADGVGTKLEVARRAGVWNTVGQDLVNHCVGDILVQGARPLFFLDYVGTGKLEPEVVAQLIEGCAIACRENGMALLGGETAEMPGLYQAGDVDLCGTIVGAVERDKLIDCSRIDAGQRLIGLPSTGLHTNGYSLARKICFERLGLSLDSTPEQLGGSTLAEALLAKHRSYLTPIAPLVDEKRIVAMAHITGGGIPDNLVRVLGSSVDAVVDRAAWQVPGLFQLLVEAGGLGRDEAYRAFNMGVGLILVVEEHDFEPVCASLSASGEAPLDLGHTIAGTGRVRWSEDA